MTEKKERYMHFFWIHLFAVPISIMGIWTVIFNLPYEWQSTAFTIASIIPFVYLALIYARYRSFRPIAQILIGAIVGCIIGIVVFFVACGAILSQL